MRKIAEFVSAGITQLADLQAALQLAMQLEFATIPPYLCAQWSIKHDPSRVEGMIHRVASEEMTHFALAGNLLAAIGGTPTVARPEFVPVYPLHQLPGEIEQPIPIELRPLDTRQLKVFMQIEHPHFPPVAMRPKTPVATIGDFYNTIIAAFRAIEPEIDCDAYAIPIFGAPPICDLSSAIDALERIKSEGEGLEDSPEQPSSQGTALAHYYTFKEIYKQKKLIRRNDEWVFEGDPITRPLVDDFRRPTSSCRKCAAFNETFSDLLRNLEEAWTAGRPLDIAGMFTLKLAGRELIRSGIRPPFCWVDSE